MNIEKKKRRWPLAFLMIIVVVIVSAALIYNFRDNLGGIPMRAISDDSGGAIIAWQDKEGIFVQRIDASGQRLWKQGGLLVSEAGAKLDPYALPQTNFTLIGDGTAGAIVTWDDKSGKPTDFNDPAYFDPVPFYAQRINSNGDFLWKGVVIASGNASLYGGEFPTVIADGTGGAIFAWNNYRPYFRALHDDFLRLQKIAPDGTRLWGDEGKLLVSSSPWRPLTEEEKAAGNKGTFTRSWPTYAGTHDIVSDDAGGCIVIWEEQGERNSYNVYAQRLENNGNSAWNQPVVVGSAKYLYNSLVSDGSGGAVLTLYLYANDSIKLPQHIGSNGEPLEARAYSPGSISDGLGGSIRVRVEADPPYGPPDEKRNILDVQRFDTAGSPLWPEKRVLATPERYQIGELEYIGDGKGGIILLWQFQKDNVAYGGIFAQKVNSEGTIMWGEQGITVFIKPDRYQGNTTLISDGSGGSLVIAIAGKNALGGNMVYAQHLDASGARLWGDGTRIDR